MLPEVNPNVYGDRVLQNSTRLWRLILLLTFLTFAQHPCGTKKNAKVIVATCGNPHKFCLISSRSRGPLRCCKLYAHIQKFGNIRYKYIIVIIIIMIMIIIIIMIIMITIMIFLKILN